MGTFKVITQININKNLAIYLETTQKR